MREDARSRYLARSLFFLRYPMPFLPHRPLLLLLIVGLIAGCDGADPAPPPPPQPTVFSVDGTVSSTLGFLVAGATVELHDAEGTSTTAATGISGTFSIDAQEGAYTLHVEKDGYVVHTEAVMLDEDVSTEIELAGDSRIQATLIDPRVSFRPLANAPLRFRLGEVKVSGTTDADGRLDFDEAPSGTWMIDVEGPGVFRGRLDVVAEPGGTDLGAITVDPVTPSTGYRVVLTWGTEPADMDLHLTWRPDASTFYPSWHCDFFGCGGRDEVIKLGDDIDGEGPETVILFTLEDGFYRISVSTYDAPLPDAYWESPAQVRVYRGSTLIKTYNPPVSSSFDDLWRVFEMTVSGTSVQFNDRNGLSIGYVYGGEESSY